jgi:mannosyltransferase
MPAGVFVVALVLGLIELDAQPLSYDERFTRDTATLPWSAIWEAARATEAPHLVYYALLKPWLAVLGTSDWALRLPSVLFGALTAAATAVVGRRLFGELAGLVAGLALASSSYFVSWSQAARGYTLAVLLATVATYAFLRACDERSRVWWATWAAVIAAAGWVSIWAFSVAAAHVAAFLLLRPGAATALFLPQVVLVVTGDNGQLDWIPTPTPYRVAVGMWDWASRNPVAVLACAIGVVQLVRGAVPHAAPWKTALVTVWFAAPLAATLLASISQPAFEARYVLVGLPAFAVAIGAAVASLPRRWAIALAVVLALSAAVRLGQHYVQPGEPLL